MDKMSDELDMLVDRSSQLKKVTKNPKKSITQVRREPSVKAEAIQLIDKALEVPRKLASDRVKLAQSQIATPAVIYEAFSNFEEAVGGRAKLLATLQHCPENSPGHNMMQRLVLDPDFLTVAADDIEKLRFSLDAICAKNKIPFNAIVAGFKDSRIAQLTIEALTTVGVKSQQVVEQLGEAATDRWVPCTNCQGKRRVKRIGDNGEFAVDETGEFVTQLCWICRGEGKVFAAHDWQNRNKFLEIVGVSKKEPLVQQTFDQRSVNIGGGATGMEGTMKALDNLLRGKQAIAVESEVIDVQPLNNQ